MKRVISLLCSVICLIMLVSCNVENEGNSTDDNSVSIPQYQENNGSNISYVDINDLSDIRVTDEDSALGLLDFISDEIGIENAKENLRTQDVNTVGEKTCYRFQQYYNDIPVYGRTVSLETDENGSIICVSSGAFNEFDDLNMEVSISEEEVERKINDYFGAGDVYLIGEISDDSLCIYVTDDAKPIICYQVVVKTKNGTNKVFVNVENGTIEKALCKVFTELSGYSVDCYNEDGSQTFAGFYNTLDRDYYLYDEKSQIYIFSNEGTDSSDSNNSNYKQTFIKSDNEFFGDVAEEKKLETDKGILMLQNIKVIRNYFIDNYSDNADQYLFCYYNDGWENGNNGYAGTYYNDDRSPVDKSIIEFGLISIGKNKRISSFDLLAHEYMHRVEQNYTCMDYSGESGAIMEAYSDIFGEILEAYVLNSTDADWMHVDSRNIKNPKKSYNPVMYGGKYFKETVDNGENNDYGHVHNNSTVISHAAYLMNTGVRGYDGLSLQQLSDVWYGALHYINVSNPTFEQCARAVYQSARTTKSITKSQLKCIESAFEEVGISGASASDSFCVYKGAKFIVKDINNSVYDNYHLLITDCKSYKIITNEDVTTDSYSINLNEGTYIFQITDNDKDSDGYSYYYKVIVLGVNDYVCKENIEVITRFGHINIDDFTIVEDYIITLGELGVIEPELSPSNATGYSIKWSSSDESVATVSLTGEAGIITTISKGITTITAELTSGGKTITKSTNLRVASKARDTVLVLDISGSMSGRPLEEMKKSAIQFCNDLLKDEFNNRVGLVFFSTKVTTVGLTNDLDMLISRIQAISDGGMTNMEGGLSAADEMLKSNGKTDSIKNVVIMADGLPNEGKTSYSGSMPGSGSLFSFFNDDYYANAVIDTAQVMMNRYNLYSLGFFHDLYGSEKDFAITLMQKLTNKTDGYHQVDKAEDLQFAFGDISETISIGSKIVINIACPVDVNITYNGETLSSSEENYCDTTSFGTLQFLGKKQDIKVASLDSDKEYEIELIGTGVGKMDYSVNYFDADEKRSDYRAFESIPITPTTVIKTNTNNTDEVELNVDEDGDGETDIIWTALSNSKASVTYGNTPPVEEPEIEDPVVEEPEEKKTEKEKNEFPVYAVVIVALGLFAVIFGIVVVVITGGSSDKTDKEIESNEINNVDMAKCSKCGKIHPSSKPCDCEKESANKEEVVETSPLVVSGASIKVETGSMKGFKVPIKDKETLYLGKDASRCNLVFTGDYKNVSRMHCSVTYDEKLNKYFVVDSSSNGTFHANNDRFVKGQRTAVEPNSILILANDECAIRLK